MFSWNHWNGVLSASLPAAGSSSESVVGLPPGKRVRGKALARSRTYGYQSGGGLHFGGGVPWLVRFGQLAVTAAGRGTLLPSQTADIHVSASRRTRFPSVASHCESLTARGVACTCVHPSQRPATYRLLALGVRGTPNAMSCTRIRAGGEKRTCVEAQARVVWFDGARAGRRNSRKCTIRNGIAD